MGKACSLSDKGPLTARVLTLRRSGPHPIKHPWCSVTAWPGASPCSMGIGCRCLSVVGHHVPTWPLSPSYSWSSGRPSSSGCEIGIYFQLVPQDTRLAHGLPPGHRLLHPWLSWTVIQPGYVSSAPAGSALRPATKVTTTDSGLAAKSPAPSFYMLTLIFLGSLRSGLCPSPCPMVPQFSPGAPGFSELGTQFSVCILPQFS